MRYKMSKVINLISISFCIISIFLISGCTYSSYTFGCGGLAPNSCNGECWADCGPNKVFKCDPSLGGRCSFDTNNCPTIVPNRCNNQCWPKCDSDRKFVCDSSLGGTCVK